MKSFISLFWLGSVGTTVTTLPSLLGLLPVSAQAERTCDFAWNEHDGFQCQVDRTLELLQEILNQTKSIQKANKQDHTYEDKYLLMEFVTLQTWTSLRHAMKHLGLDLTRVYNRDSSGSSAVSNSNSQAVLKFRGQTKCNMIKKEEVDVKGDAVEQTNSMGVTSTQRKLHQVTLYTWAVNESYKLSFCAQEDSDNDCTVLKQRNMTTQVVTTTSEEPADCLRINEPVPLEIGWLLHRFLPDKSGQEGSFHFKIDREVRSCKTPRRNEDVERVLKSHERMKTWFSRVRAFLQNIYLPPTTERDSALLSQLGALFQDWHTNLPLLENSTILSDQTIQWLHANEEAELARRLSDAASLFSPLLGTAGDESIMVSEQEASLYLVLRHIEQILQLHRMSTNFVEQMLRDQLIQAIGKEIQEQDFRQYMKFHGKQFFANEFAPQPFSIAIREGNSTPVGSFLLEEYLSEGGFEPVQLLSRIISGKGRPPVRIPIDAATQVQITGDRILSGWIRYKFGGGGRASTTTRLVARARQFSSFIFMVGTITGPDSFDPKHAIILTNKDEAFIPILSETLPSAKEFKDAISSLSPEQQEFARAFRTMQLESSVFGICVIRIKPQVEKLLNLPAGSLAKEIQLTEDLTSLFVEYQIPADLLSFDGDSNLNASGKVAVVTGYVKAVMNVINKAKKTLAEEEHIKRMNLGGMYTDYPTESIYKPSFVPTGSPSYYPSCSPSSVPSSSEPLTSTQRTTSADRSMQTNFESSQAKQSSKEFFLSEKTTPAVGAPTEIDFTKVPKLIDAKLELHDSENYLRSMIIKAKPTDWDLKRRANLLVDAALSTLQASNIANEKNKAFDLLDAISRSGSLPVDSAELHVMIGVSHDFVNSLLETLYQDNIQPIEKVEKSLIILASEVLGKEPKNFVRNHTDLKRLATLFPKLVSEE